MPSRRIVFCVPLLTVALVAGLLAQEPRETIGPLEQKANAITPENPVPRRTISSPAVYPPEAGAVDATATVTLVATIDGSGRVAEVRKFNNPLVITPGGTASPAALRTAGEALVRAAADALRLWQYEPPANAPISFPITFHFTPNGEPTALQDVTGRRLLAPPPPPPPPPGGTVIGFTTPAATGAVRVGGELSAPLQTKRVPPVYPAEARAAQVQGVVILEVLIGVDGKVLEVRVLRSIPLLDDAAVTAVRQWEYTPSLLNGVPTPVIMTATVNFTLG